MIPFLATIMAEDWGEEVEATTTEVEMPEVKLFGKWSTDEVQVGDISLQDYIACKVSESWILYFLKQPQTPDQIAYLIGSLGLLEQDIQTRHKLSMNPISFMLCFICIQMHPVLTHTKHIHFMLEILN